MSFYVFLSGANLERNGDPFGFLIILENMLVVVGFFLEVRGHIFNIIFLCSRGVFGRGLRNFYDVVFLTGQKYNNKGKYTDENKYICMYV